MTRRRKPGQPENPWCDGGYREPVEGYHGVPGALTPAGEPAGIGYVGTCPNCGQMFGLMPRSGAIPEHEVRRG